MIRYMDFLHDVGFSVQVWKVTPDGCDGFKDHELLICDSSVLYMGWRRCGDSYRKGSEMV